MLVTRTAVGQSATSGPASELAAMIGALKLLDVASVGVLALPPPGVGVWLLLWRLPLLPLVLLAPLVCVLLPRDVRLALLELGVMFGLIVIPSAAAAAEEPMATLRREEGAGALLCGARASMIIGAAIGGGGVVTTTAAAANGTEEVDCGMSLSSALL